MSYSENFKRQIPFINSSTFLESAIDLFKFQYENNALYRTYCDYLKTQPSRVSRLTDIPFLPIDFFKHHKIQSGSWIPRTVFKSSGTTATGRSHHYVRDMEYYRNLTKIHFEERYDSLHEYQLIALLPSYQEQGHSSLISMIDYFLQFTATGSGYYLHEEIDTILATDHKKILFGVSYALLDVAEKGIPTRQCTIIETGGMKGRKKEITRYELHERLKSGFGVEEVHSEYGMTELFSQAYGPHGRFTTPSWMKVLIRDINDPFDYVENGKTGGINVIDLANVETCAFIETKDLGRKNKGIFEVLGRFDNSDVRGCNLLI